MTILLNIKPNILEGKFSFLTVRLHNNLCSNSVDIEHKLFHRLANFFLEASIYYIFLLSYTMLDL